VINPSTGNPYYSIRKALLRAAKKAEIEKDIDHHLLRHTFLSLAAEKEVFRHMRCSRSLTIVQ